MSVPSRWRVVETPGYDMVGADAYILFGEEGGEFAFDCLTGSIHGTSRGDDVEFDWDGNDEREQAAGYGWAELQSDGFLEGEVCTDNGDDIPFIAHRPTFSTAATRRIARRRHECNKIQRAPCLITCPCLPRRLAEIRLTRNVPSLCG
jgi:hypothetical protein